jgi:hypothetical protein
MSLTSPAPGTASGAGSAARQAGNSKTLELAARVGFLAKGLVYALVGLLAIQVAAGDHQEADQKGALEMVASQTGGSVVLWLMVVGFAAYALWRFTEAAWGRKDERDERMRTVKRIGSAANGLVYLAFGVLAFQTVTEAASSGGGTSTTAKVLDWPGGQTLVFVAGLVIIAIAIGLAVRGLRTDFEKHLKSGQMSRRVFQVVRRLGQVGYIARGIVFSLVGALVIKAAMEFSPKQAEGFDAALKEVAQAPYGPFLLVATALGFICFGAYCVAEARYRRL